MVLVSTGAPGCIWSVSDLCGKWSFLVSKITTGSSNVFLKDTVLRGLSQVHRLSKPPTDSDSVKTGPRNTHV